MFLHYLHAAQVEVANREEDDRGQTLKDAMRKELDGLAGRYRDIPEVAAPILYRLAKGYDFLGSRPEADFWLSRLLAAPDRGVLGESLRYRNLVSEFQTLLRTLRSGPLPAESMDEMWRILDEGMNAPTLRLRRAAWARSRVSLVTALAAQSMAAESTQGNRPISTAAEPPRPGLAPDHAESLFEAVMDQVAWRTGGRLASLSRLLDYGIEPQRVLEEAIILEQGAATPTVPAICIPETGVRRGSVPGSPGSLPHVFFKLARRRRLGETEMAGQLFEEFATESPGSQTLAEFGRHLMRTGQPERGLDMLVEALAHGGDWRRAADEAAATAGLTAGAIDERLAERRPIVQGELEAQALAERLELEPPALALSDQNGDEWALGDLSGKVVVLKFWASWCGYSLAELPHFTRLLEKYEDDDAVVFLTVATAGSSREEVNALLSENNYAFPVLFDDEAKAIDFAVLAYPTTLFLDPDGLIQYRREGFYEDGYARQTAIRIDALR